MKKETAIAILLGVGLGLIVAIGVTLKTRSKDTKKVTPISHTLNITPSVTAKSQSSTLEISQPEDDSIAPAKTVLIKGKAPKNSLIVIQSPIQTVTFTNDKEDFSQNFSLALGENVIVVTAYPKDQNGTGIERDLKVYFLDEE